MASCRTSRSPWVHGIAPKAGTSRKGAAKIKRARRPGQCWCVPKDRSRRPGHSIASNRRSAGADRRFHSRHNAGTRIADTSTTTNSPKELCAHKQWSSYGLANASSDKGPR